MTRILAVFLAAVGLVTFLPARAHAVTLVTCPEVGPSERFFGIDLESLSSGTAECFAYGTGNNLTGSPASDDFLTSSGLTFFDYDNSSGQTDNFFSFTQLGDSPDLAGYVYGGFSFGAAYTDAVTGNTELYLGLKVGNNLDPAWAVFKLYDFDANLPLTGEWYIVPKQGAGISHASIYGDDLPPGVEPDPAVPEPASLLLLGTGLAAVAGASRRRLKNRK